jgi:hypothetical protein
MLKYKNKVSYYDLSMINDAASDATWTGFQLIVTDSLCVVENIPGLTSR